MPARTIVSQTPAERTAVRSRHTIAGRLAARDILRSTDAEDARIPDGAYNEASTWSDQLDRYLEGWADASPGKIVEQGQAPRAAALSRTAEADLCAGAAAHSLDAGWL